MLLDHVGIINDKEESAVRFYSDFLGLEKIKESGVEPALSRQLFSIDRTIKMLVYGREGVKVEIFILPGFVPPSPAIAHFCLQVDDLGRFIERAKEAGVKVISGERAGRTVYFVEDFSGNLIEIKPALH